jgi:serine/threonine protein kinase
MLGTAGPYRLISRLARGGVGEVFLAADPSVAGIERQVVVKRLFANWAREPKVAALFEHEARLLAEMAHPAVPQVYAYATDDAGPFMAMEFAPGIDLAALLERGQRLPLAHAIVIALQLLEALAHVHTRTTGAGEPMRVVHRDVAPANIRVGPGGSLALLDFGVAQSVWLGADRSDARGSPGYLAPEVVQARAVDPRADLFAVGVIVHEMLTGQRLFDGGALVAMGKIVEGERVPPSRIEPAVPDALDRVVLRALSVEPDERFATAEEMALAIEQCAAAANVIPSRLALGRWLCVHHADRLAR